MTELLHGFDDLHGNFGCLDRGVECDEVVVTLNDERAVDDEADILFWLSAVVRLIIVGCIVVTGHVGNAS